MGITFRRHDFISTFGKDESFTYLHKVKYVL